MRKLSLLLCLLLSPLLARAQVSGAGQLSCSGVTSTGTAVTSGTANNTVLANVTGTPAYAVLVQLDQTTTVTAGAITFQISNDGGANYVTAPVAQVLNPSTGAQLTNPYTLVASTNQSFLVVLAGASTFQIKLTTALTGSGTVTPYYTILCTQPTVGPLTLNSAGLLKTDNAPSVDSGDAASACNILSAASTNSTSCKGSAGNFYGYEIYNTTTTIYYLRLYNSSSAPTCSSATGFIRTIPIPPAGAAGQAGGAISNQLFPVNYGTGIGYCLTGGSSSTDNTNAATGVFGEIRYK